MILLRPSGLSRLLEGAALGVDSAAFFAAHLFRIAAAIRFLPAGLIFHFRGPE
jgi:hypothetical protein